MKKEQETNMIWLYIIGGLTLITILFLNTYAKIQIEITVTSIHTQLRIDVVYIFWFKKAHQQYFVDLDIILNLIESYIKDPSNDKENSNRGIRHYFEKFNATQEELKTFYYYLKRFRIDEITWETTIGLRDADKTGLYSGSLWALKGVLLSVLSSITKLKDFRINITPDFANYKISSEFSCILRIRLVHIIRINILRWLSKIRGYYNGIRSTRKTNWSSHRKFDENCHG